MMDENLMDEKFCITFAIGIYDLLTKHKDYEIYNTMIKKGKFRKFNGKLIADELNSVCDKLADNQEYVFAIADFGKARNLPYTTYLLAWFWHIFRRHCPTTPVQ